MTTADKRHWKRYKIHTKLIIVKTSEEYICEAVDISHGGVHVKFSDTHDLKVNDICKVLTKVHETELLGIDINSSSNDLVSVSVEEDRFPKSFTEEDLQLISDWEEFPVLAAITWIDNDNVGLEFEETLSDQAKMPKWFKEVFYSEKTH